MVSLEGGGALGETWRESIPACAFKSAFPVFEKMIDGEFKEAADLVINLGDMVQVEQARAFAALCAAHYGTTIQVRASQVIGLASGGIDAHRRLITSMRTICGDTLHASIAKCLGTRPQIRARHGGAHVPSH